MNEYSNQKVIKNILITICFSVLPFQAMLLGYYLKNPNIPQLYTSIAYIISTVLALLSLRIIKKTYLFSFKVQNMKMTLTKGWYLIVAGIIFALLNLLNLNVQNGTTVYAVVMFLVSTMLTALFEEIVFRGIIQNLLIEYYKKNGESYFKGIVVASVIFGLVHLLNLIGAPHYVVGTITQVIYTFCMGMILGVVYKLANSIWPVVILHFVFNTLGYYDSVFMQNTVNSNTTPSDLPLLGVLVQLAIMLPCIIVALRQKNNI